MNTDTATNTSTSVPILPTFHTLFECTICILKQIAML